MMKYVVFGLMIASALAVPTPDNNNNNLDCLAEDEMFTCLAVKAVTNLQRAARSADVNLIDGVTFVRDTPVERTAKSMVKSEKEVMKDLPRDISEKSMQLITMIYEAGKNFLESHSLKVNLPQARTLDEVLELPGKKSKKMLMPFIAAAGLKLLALVPIFIGGLALLVGKALIVGKFALILAGILAFQRFFGAGATAGGFAGHGGPGAILGGNLFGRQPQYADSSAYSAVGQPAGYNYKRSFEDKAEAAQQLAYSAQVPSNNAENH